MNIREQLDLFTGPHAVARYTDPQTSWKAAKAITGIRESQARVWEALTNAGPMTDTEILEAVCNNGFAISPSGCRTRRKELCELGLIASSTTREVLTGNKNSIHTVWRATPINQWLDENPNLRSIR